MTLSVMDDLEFNTRYECAKCERLESELKTSKSEVILRSMMIEVFILLSHYLAHAFGCVL